MKKVKLYNLLIWVWQWGMKLEHGFDEKQLTDEYEHWRCLKKLKFEMKGKDNGPFSKLTKWKMSSLI